MPHYYIRRKNNPLRILARAYTTAAGQVRDFDESIYEEVQGELPEGWEMEPKPKPASNYLDELAELFQTLDLSIQYTFLQSMAGVTAAAQRNNIPLMKYILEQTEVSTEWSPIKDAMLAIFEET